MLAAAVLAVLATAISSATAVEIRTPCAASCRCGAPGDEESCCAAGVNTRSTMLLQFSMKQERSSLSQQLLGTTPSSKVSRDSPLARILKRAQKNSEASGQPFEFLLDVDYLHDANNPLDNDGKETSNPPVPSHEKKEQESNPVPSEERQGIHQNAPVPSEENKVFTSTNKESNSDDDGKETTNPPAPSKGKVFTTDQESNSTDDRPTEGSFQPSPSPADEIMELESTCVTRADVRVASTALSNVAELGTACVFGADERDEGTHCIMQGGEYGSYGWCFTDMDQSQWGSCSEACPLSGVSAILQKRIDAVDKIVGVIAEKVRNKSGHRDATNKAQLKPKAKLKPEAQLEIFLHSKEQLKPKAKPAQKRMKSGKLAEILQRAEVQPSGTSSANAESTRARSSSELEIAHAETTPEQRAHSSSEHVNKKRVDELASLLRDGLISNEEFEDLMVEAESPEN